MKKKLLLAPLMAVLVACVVVLSGCGGPSVEELITEDLTTQFDEVKNGGDDFLSGLEEASGDEFEQLGIDPKEYAKTYLEGFDYKIGDVTVDEDKGVATAEVSITCKSMNKIVEDFSTQYQEKVAALDTVVIALDTNSEIPMPLTCAIAFVAVVPENFNDIAFLVSFRLVDGYVTSVSTLPLLPTPTSSI